MTDIHHNLPAIHLPFFTLFDGILAGTFICGVTLIIWKIWKNFHNQAKSPLPPLEEIFLPKEFSLENELQLLQKLQTSKKWKKFSLHATATFKKILERRFKKPFAFATGKEIEHLLLKDIPPQERQHIQRFFSLLDPIKFAKADGKKEIAGEIFQILRSI